MKTTENKGDQACRVCHSVPNAESGLCLCPRPPAAEVESLDFSPNTLTLAAQAESLFENYLAARLVRARHNLTAAKIALLRDPRNRAKRNEVREAEIEAKRLQIQLIDQTRKSVQNRANEPSRSTISVAPIQPHDPSTEATESFRATQAAKAEGTCATTNTRTSPQEAHPEHLLGDENVMNPHHDAKSLKHAK